MIWPLHRRTKTPTPPNGAAIQRAEHEAAKARLLQLAERRRAAGLPDGLTFGVLP